MRNIIVQPDSFWRISFPLLARIRAWAWKIYDRIALRFVVSGGEIEFMEARLRFPEGVALTYSTPLFWSGPDAYEAPTSRTLALLISRSRVFLDIGSNVGIYAVYAGVRFPEVTTYAFEPVPAIWRKNKAFHAANGLSDSRVMHLAIGDRNGPQQFLLPVYTTGVEEEQTGTLQSDSWQAAEANLERIEVTCTTLDEFTRTHELPAGRCCVKIDVENHEAAVFRGAQEFIRARRPWIVCEVLPNQKLDEQTGLCANDNDEVIALVEALDYAIFVLTADGFFRMRARDFRATRSMKDFLFLPREAVAEDVSYFSRDSLAEWLSVP